MKVQTLTYYAAAIASQSIASCTAARTLRGSPAPDAAEDAAPAFDEAEERRLRNGGRAYRMFANGVEPGLGDEDFGDLGEADAFDPDAPLEPQSNLFNQLDKDTRIIGGSAASTNDYPYIASLQDYIGPFCGGSLIHKKIVLTAA